MIRSDGVVKLMDFGISHMVDLERLTVTGQLLGSPAYMAPEHVEGRPIDYRTDVFAAGIVLYQLTVGRLPFEGKNPHEVLKRIAECKFVDPRQANTRIGNRLGKIILRAMAAEPADRYAAIGEMVTALEGYLDESGIAADKVQSELSRYFAAPPSYELALEERLIDHLTRRGVQLLAQQERALALDIFDRVLTIDADNEKVIAILDGINRRTRMKAYAMTLGFFAVMAGGAYMIHKRSQPPDNEVPVDLGNGTVAINDRDTTVVKDPEPPPLPVIAPDGGSAVIAFDDARGAIRPPEGDGGGLTPPVGIATTFRVFPEKEAQFRIGKGDWQAVPDGGAVTINIAAETEVEVRNNSGCCTLQTQTLRPGEPNVVITTGFKPATLKFDCTIPGASVQVEGRSVRLDTSHTVPFENETQPTKSVKVEFLGEQCKPDDKDCKLVDATPKRVPVAAGKIARVSCDSR
jgi:serine/threonine-protein kinase